MIKNRLSNIIFLYAFVLVLFTGCSGGNERTDLDSPESGSIHICVDESFRPVIDEQIKVYEALHPGTKIYAEYKPEAECFKDLLKDSTRMIFVTRGLTEQEEEFYGDSLSYLPKWSKIAYDAIAVIVNKDAPDSLFTLNELRGILTGTTADKQVAVFDGLSGSSVFRYITDSVLRNQPFSPEKVFGVQSSTEVIERVEQNKNLIGFVGVNWIGNKEDSTQMSFLNKVRIVSLACKRCPGNPYTKPYQANILRKRYPLVRGLYYILKENYSGLGSGFANFLEQEKGQLIFRRSYLAPAKLNFTIRAAILKSE